MADTQATLEPGTPRRRSKTLPDTGDIKYRTVDLVQGLLSVSQTEMGRLRRIHEQALLNSMAAREWDVYVDAGNIYGLGGGWEGRGPVSNMKSLFTAEQVNAITTRLIQPILAQREMLYVEPSGPESVRAAAVREQLFDIAMNSLFNPKAEIFWQVFRDVVVKSRGYLEVVALRQSKMRKVYKYTDLTSSFGPLWAALAPQFGMAPDELMREDSFEEVVLYDGPVFVPRSFEQVYIDRSQNASSHRRYQIIERQMALEEAIELGKRLFPRGASRSDPYDTTEKATVPFDEKAVRAEYGRLGSTSYSGPFVTNRWTAAQRESDVAEEYEPVTILEFRGEDPDEGPDTDHIAWVIGDICVGRDKWKGSGTPLNLVEFMWDPMVGFSTSASPAIMLLREQEKLDLLSSCELDGALYASHPTGAVNMGSVRSIAELKSLKPGDRIEKLSNENIFEEITVGRYTEFLPELINNTESRARLGTAANTAVIGGAQPGVDTATEYSGISRGAFDRIAAQVELNVDGGLRKLAELVWDIYRDSLVSDQQLRDILGNDPDVAGATLQDLDGPMKIILMGPRYHAMNQAEVQAMDQLGQFFMNDPTGEAQDQIDMDKFRQDYALAVTRRSVRWLRDPLTVQQIRTQRQQQQAAQMAQQGTQGGKTQPQQNGQSGPPAAAAGQPSPPAPVPTTPADIVNQTVNAA